jgi:hypothetical protein
MALQKWLTYEGTEVFHIDGSAYTYQTSFVALDADGSPRAYNPSDTGLDLTRTLAFRTKDGALSWLLIRTILASRLFRREDRLKAASFLRHHYLIRVQTSSRRILQNMSMQKVFHILYFLGDSLRFVELAIGETLSW